MSLVRLQKISKSFNDKPVLRDVYFRLNQGDRAGLIGKNGVGKTTILRLILGRDDPSQGTIDIDKGLKIGYFSQFSELKDEKSILEILDLNDTVSHTLNIFGLGFRAPRKQVNRFL